MASLMCQKKSGGTMKIHDKEVVDSVISDGEKAATQMEIRLKRSRRQTKKPEERVSSAPHTHLTSPIQSQAESKTNSQAIKEWLSDKAIKDLQERTDHESQDAKKLYTPLLDTEATFVKDVGHYLSHQDLIGLRKKEVLHKRWTDQVYQPIRRKIHEAMDGMEWDQLDRRKREMHRQFLEHVNKRGFVFLEDDDREEYYAQALNDHRPSPIKIRTEALSDPLLTLGKRQAEEDRVVLRCLTGQRYTDKDIAQVRLPPLPLVPLGRHGVDSLRWLEMPLGNIESECRHRSRRRMLGNGTKTEIDFGEWAKTGFEPKIVEKELQIPRRKCYEEVPPYGRPPAEIPRAPFIDSEDFSDKIVNINPFPEHRAALKAELEEAATWWANKEAETDTVATMLAQTA